MVEVVAEVGWWRWWRRWRVEVVVVVEVVEVVAEEGEGGGGWWEQRCAAQGSVWSAYSEKNPEMQRCLVSHDETPAPRGPNA